MACLGLYDDFQSRFKNSVAVHLALSRSDLKSS